MTTITLQQIWDATPCAESWAKGLAALGYAAGNYDPERTVTLGDIAVALGAPDAWWAAARAARAAWAAAMAAEVAEGAAEAEYQLQVSDIVAVFGTTETAI